MSEEEYDIKKSEENIGQILPIIKDSKGRIVDGLHRERADPEWKVEVWDQIKTDEDYWKYRAHLNYSRRNPHDARQEKLTIINSLAEYYVGQGLNVSGGKRGDGNYLLKLMNILYLGTINFQKPMLIKV